MPHVKGPDFTNETLTKMRTDQSFDHCSPGWRTDASKKATRSGQTGGWCWCTWAIFPNCRRSLLRFLEGSITRLLILSSLLSISALIRKASAPTPRWRLSRLKLLMVTTMRQSSRFLKHHTAKMLIACERQTFLLAHRRRRSSSRHVLQRR